MCYNRNNMKQGEPSTMQNTVYFQLIPSFSADTWTFIEQKKIKFNQ
jgi:hypothetical protein